MDRNINTVNVRGAAVVRRCESNGSSPLLCSARPMLGSLAMTWFANRMQNSNASGSLPGIGGEVAAPICAELYSGMGNTVVNSHG